MPLPRYKQSTELQPQQITANPELAKVQSIDTFVNSILAQTRKEAVIFASKKGAEAGERETKPSLAIVGGEAAQEYNKELLRANKFKINSDISNGLSKILSDISSNNIEPENALKEFGAKYSAFATSYIENVPQPNQSYAKMLMVDQSERELMKLQGLADKNRLLKSYIAGMDNIDSYERNISKSAESGNTKNSEFYLVEGVKSINFQEQNGIMPVITAQRLKEKLHQTYIESNIVGQYKATKAFDQANGTNKAKEFKEKLLSDANIGESSVGEYLPQQKRIRMLQVLESFDNQEKFANNINSTEYSNRAKDIIAKTRLSGQLPTSDDIAYLNGKPEQAKVILNEVNNMRTVHSIVNNPQTVQQLYQTMSDVNNFKPQNRDAEIVRNEALSGLKNRIDTFNDDPVGAVIQSPLYTDALNTKLTSVFGSSDFVHGGKAIPDDYYKVHSDVLLALQSSAGVPYQKQQIQTNEQRQSDINTISSMPIVNAVNFLENKKEQYKGNFPIYIRGIGGKNGIPSYYIPIMNMTENPKQRPFVADVISAYQLPEADMHKIINSKGSDVKSFSSDLSSSISSNSDIQSFLGTIDVGTPEGIQSESNVVDMLNKVSTYYYSRGFSISDSTKNAYDRIFGMRYSYVGDTYRVINDVNPGKVRSMMKYIDSNKSKFNIVYPSSGDLQKGIFAKLFSLSMNKGHWINDPSSNDEGYMFVNDHGVKAYTPDGFTLFGVHHPDRKYLSFNISDLENEDFKKHHSFLGGFLHF